MFQETKLDEAKYQVLTLSKNENQKLPNKLEAVPRKLKPLQKRLQRNPELFSKYKQSIDNYIKQSYARKLTEEEREKVSNRNWYLPHHSVFNPKKTEKIRVLFDAAAIIKNIV